MKAAIITSAGQTPVYGDFADPVSSEGREIITVSASALSQFSKSRSLGSHYSSSGQFPSVAGADGVGHAGRMGGGSTSCCRKPSYGALAEKSLVRSEQCIAIPGRPSTMSQRPRSPIQACPLGLP